MYGTLTGLALEKKSINLPIVNGTLIDTALDTESSAIATPSGFFSGIARATILRNEEVLLVVASGSCDPDGRKRLHSDFFSPRGEGLLGGFDGVDEGVSEGGARDGVEEDRCRRPRTRLQREFESCRKARHEGLETCRVSRAGTGGR